MKFLHHLLAALPLGGQLEEAPSLALRARLTLSMGRLTDVFAQLLIASGWTEAWLWYLDQQTYSKPLVAAATSHKAGLHVD